jgi:ribosomal 50S subunit-recycling heat shock protein
MRLDKFLKVSRIIKRRTLAKEVCDQERVWINGRPAKASTEVAEGDEIAILFGHKKLVVKVERILENPRKEEAGELYTVVREEKAEKPDFEEKF